MSNTVHYGISHRAAQLDEDMCIAAMVLVTVHNTLKAMDMVTIAMISAGVCINIATLSLPSNSQAQKRLISKVIPPTTIDMISKANMYPPCTLSLKLAQIAKISSRHRI